ncbi:MAG: serine hydrolase [Pseudomonadota bacterium]
MTQNFAVADVNRLSVDGIPHASERRSLDLALLAKHVCSGVFVSGRSVDDILEMTAHARIANGAVANVDVNRERKLVTASLPSGEARSARVVGDHGAVILPIGSAKAFFCPQVIETKLPPSDKIAWPLGDVNACASPGEEWDEKVLKEGVDRAFSFDPDPFTAAFIIAHKGKIIAERYGAGADRMMQLPSWSMGKTLTAILLGRLLMDHAYDIDSPAPIAEWSGPDDPRSKITIADLLQMSSGLNFSAAWSPDYTPDHGYPDHNYMYSAAIDCFSLALSREAAHPPGTFGAYKNGDTLALGALIKRTVESNGGVYLSWPQRALFDKIGIRKLILEPDPYGNLLTSGFGYGTARDWVRLGLLLLNDGVFDGERLLPDGFVDFMRRPAPGWSGRYWMSDGPAGWNGSIYGGQLWLNRYPSEDRWPLPDDAYFMLGIGGQYCFVAPSMDLVVVRMGHVRGFLDRDVGRAPMSEPLALITKAYRRAGS